MTPRHARGRDAALARVGVIDQHLPDGPLPPGQIVLLLPRRTMHWEDLLHSYRVIERQTGFMPVMVLATPELENHPGPARRQGINFIAVAAVPQQDQGHFRFAAGVARALRRLGLPGRLAARLLASERIRHGSVVGLARLAVTRVWLRRQCRQAARLLEALSPAALLLSGDRELGPFPAWQRAARDRRVPCVVAGVTLPSPDSDAFGRFHRARFFAGIGQAAPLINLVAAWCFPRQCRRADGRRLLFTPGWLTLALALAGMRIPMPWVQGSNSDAILTDCEARKALYVANGIPAARVRITGRVLYDDLFRLAASKADLRRRLLDDLAMPADLPIVLVSVPASAEHGLMDARTHYEKIEELLDHLASLNANIILSLHPRSDRQDYAKRIRETKLRLLDKPLFQYMAAADVFVCEASTTIDWAILCGVPTVDLQHSGIRIETWREFPGVLAFDRLDEAMEAIDRLIRDPATHARLQAAQMDGRDRICLFDGKCADRFRAVLESICAPRDSSVDRRLPAGSR